MACAGRHGMWLIATPPFQGTGTLSASMKLEEISKTGSSGGIRDDLMQTRV